MSTPADSNLVGRYASAQEIIDSGQTGFDRVDGLISHKSNAAGAFDFMPATVFSWYTTGGSIDGIRAQRGNVTNFDLITPRAAENANASTFEFLQIADERINAPYFIHSTAVEQADIGPARNAAQKTDQRKVPWLKKFL